MKKIPIILFLMFITTFTFSQEKRMSILGSPLTYGIDIAWLFVDKDIETFVLLTDVQYQYAISNYLGVSISNTIYFENYLSSYLENRNGIFNKDYGKQFSIMFEPAFMYHPFGTWLKGWYINAFPVIGWSYVSTKDLDDGFTHLGLGITSGYQWIFENGFTIELGGGLSKNWIIRFGNNKGKYRAEDEWHLLGVPFDFRLDFRLGYSW